MNFNGQIGQTASKQVDCLAVYLTLLGGGAFGNDPKWILDAIRRAAKLYRRVDLDVKIVSFRHSNPAIRKLCGEALE